MSEPSATPTASGGPQRSFAERLWGALRLEASVYEEVEHDSEALGQAAGVIALGAVAQGLASVGVGGLGALVAAVVFAFVAWFVDTAIVWAIGVKAMSHTSDYRELLRTLGFASAPKLLMVIGIVPLGPLHVVLALGVLVLTLIAFVIAVRQALDVETGRAVLVCAIAIGIELLLSILVLGGAASG